QLVILGVTSQCIEALVLSAYAVGAARLRGTAAAKRTSQLIERLGGAILVAIALRIATEPAS
ncbi:MAG TPA: hypothetical protein VGD50_01560, partial [Candidatus Baltobacteraceae bacterium]